MINEIVKKIDAEIAYYQNLVNEATENKSLGGLIGFQSRLSEAERIREIILAEQKVEDEEFQKVFAEVDAYKNELYPNGAILAEQKNNGWIPVSEHLPELTPNEVEDFFIARPYMVTRSQRNDRFTIPAMYYFQRKEWRDCFGKGQILSNVIAWQPLLEPYKENAYERKG